MAKRFYEVEVFGEGGEYNCGVISEEEKVEFLKFQSENEDLNFDNENEDDEDLNSPCFDYTDIVGSYGINVSSDADPVIKVREFEVDANGERTEEYKSLDPIFETGEISIASFNNPHFNSEQLEEEFGEDSIILRGLNSEKKITATYLIETKNEFNPDNLIFATTLMDETFFIDDEVLDQVLYVEKEALFAHILKKIENAKEDKEHSEDELFQKDIESYERILSEYKENLENDYAAVMPECLTELSSDLRYNRDIKMNIQNLKFNFEEFECECIGDPEGRSNFTEVKILTLDGDDI